MRSRIAIALLAAAILSYGANLSTAQSPTSVSNARAADILNGVFFLDGPEADILNGIVNFPSRPPASAESRKQTRALLNHVLADAQLMASFRSNLGQRDLFAIEADLLAAGKILEAEARRVVGPRKLAHVLKSANATNVVTFDDSRTSVNVSAPSEADDSTGYVRYSLSVYITLAFVIAAVAVIAAVLIVSGVTVQPNSPESDLVKKRMIARVAEVA